MLTHLLAIEMKMLEGQDNNIGREGGGLTGVSNEENVLRHTIIDQLLKSLRKGVRGEECC